MKSAIFSESERPSKPRGFRRTLSQKKAKSSSPFSPAAATPNSPAPTTPVSAPKSSAWNVDDMISSYVVSGQLPQLLSPTLPPQFAKPDFPDLYDNDEHDPYEHDEDTTRSPHASDIDNLPISLLSPTLPTMFEPKSEHGGSETSSKSPRKSPSKARVRWVNKLNDSKKPRFLVRMTVSSSSLRNVTPKTALKGLGITEAAASDSKPTSPAGSPKNEAALYWQKLAKSAMSHADRVRSKDPLFSVVIQFDWILCLVIANDYEEKASNPSSTHIGKIWTTFLDDIPPFVSRIEKYIKTHNVQDKKKAYLTFLVGVLTTLKALVFKRIIGSLKAAVENSTQSKSRTLELQSQIIADHQTISDTLAEAQSFFTLCPSPSTVFPKSWHNRATPVQKANHELPLSPSSDKYYAPVGSYSDLRDACGYLYCCLREFMELYGSEMNEGNKYSFQSGKRYSN
ncbi:hypothetical protein FT663_04318 [Candidozyma haemuli var. vulneris]|nr:hypothetical protein FT662_04402 [[Candida] haemuloni var. vulneris]KAF3987798.1 hypothetical protein FT663_04318 [[Candida] haemuloni var. vulneris]